MMSSQINPQLIEKDELLSLVPHRGCMFLISRVHKYDLEEFSLEGEYVISGDCIFFDKEAGGVPAWAGLEFMAQAVSVLVGLWRRERGEDIRLGFLVSMSSVKILNSIFELGEILELKVKLINQIDTVYTFDGSVSLDGITVLQGKMTMLDVDEEKMQVFQKEYESIG